MRDFQITVSKWPLIPFLGVLRGWAEGLFGPSPEKKIGLQEARGQQGVFRIQGREGSSQQLGHHPIERGEGTERVNSRFVLGKDTNSITWDRILASVWKGSVLPKRIFDAYVWMPA